MVGFPAGKWRALRWAEKKFTREAAGRGAVIQLGAGFDLLDEDIAAWSRGVINARGEVTRLIGGDAEPEPGARRPNGAVSQKR